MMKNKYELIKNMDAENLAVILAKGGFCPELVETPDRYFDDESLLPFFEEETDGFGCEIDRKSPSERKEMCTECIKEFLSECAVV